MRMRLGGLGPRSRRSRTRGGLLAHVDRRSRYRRGPLEPVRRRRPQRSEATPTASAARRVASLARRVANVANKIARGFSMAAAPLSALVAIATAADLLSSPVTTTGTVVDARRSYRRFGPDYELLMRSEGGRRWVAVSYPFFETSSKGDVL